MKRKLFALALATPLSLFSVARAQSPLERASDAQEASDQANARIETAADAPFNEGDGKAAAATPAKTAGDENLGVAPVEGASQADFDKEAAPVAPDTYTVRKGDTLWDLSGRFLNNPWYWPKVWSFNPEITNPNWITPGSVLRFYPSEEGPTRVEKLAAAGPTPAKAGEAEAEETVEPPRELEDLSRADMRASPSEEERDAVAVAGPYKIGYHAKKTVAVRADSFVTPRELEESGVLVGAFEDRFMLTATDRTYARFKVEPKVKPGEVYVIYRTEGPIRHPVTHELFGYQSTVLGSAKVVAVSQKTATLVITESRDPIERGALLAPFTEKPPQKLERRPNAVELAGRIIAGQESSITQFGENNVVFVDKGSADGVVAGNVFTVFNAGDPYKQSNLEPTWDPKLPVEAVGELLVVEVKERASAALVLRSIHELAVGDRVEMHLGSKSADK